MTGGVCCCFCSILPRPLTAYRRLCHQAMAAGDVAIQVPKSLVNRVTEQASCRIEMVPYFICQALSPLASEFSCPFHATRRMNMTKLLWPKKKYVVRMSSTIVNPSTQTEIYGFWIGPDTEDGCGYVKVAIDRIL